MIRPRRVPYQPLSDQESRVLSWMKFGGSLWASAQLSDLSVTEVERWMENGVHRAFAREVQLLSAASGQQPATGSIVGKVVHGPNGQASNLLVRWDD